MIDELKIQRALNAGSDQLRPLELEEDEAPRKTLAELAAVFPFYKGLVQVAEYLYKDNPEALEEARDRVRPRSLCRVSLVGRPGDDLKAACVLRSNSSELRRRIPPRASLVLPLML